MTRTQCTIDSRQKRWIATNHVKLLLANQWQPQNVKYHTQHNWVWWLKYHTLSLLTTYQIHEWPTVQRENLANHAKYHCWQNEKCISKVHSLTRLPITVHVPIVATPGVCLYQHYAAINQNAIQSLGLLPIHML